MAAPDRAGDESRKLKLPEDLYKMSMAELDKYGEHLRQINKDITTNPILQKPLPNE
jgi:hypothetical protein